MVEREVVMEALRTVEDPELELSVVELGLIYDVRFNDSDNGTNADIDMTLTSPGCPVAPEIMAAVHRAALGVDGVDDQNGFDVDKTTKSKTCSLHGLFVYFE